MELDSKEGCEKFISYTFMQGTYHSRTVKLKEGLANKLALCFNSYPCDLSYATSIIINYKNYVNNPNHPGKKNCQSKKYS